VAMHYMFSELYRISTGVASVISNACRVNVGFGLAIGRTEFRLALARCFYFPLK
jgi:hypothetical protein